MDGAVHLLALIGLDLVLLLGWIAIPLGLGGNFILFAAALGTALITRFTAVGWPALLIILAAVVIGEIVEAVLGSLMARKYGASRWGMLGAAAGGLAGGLLGTALVPLFGTLAGAVAGTAVGAFLVEWIRLRKARPSLRAARGALVGRVLATAFKVAVGTGIAVFLIARTH